MAVQPSVCPLDCPDRCTLEVTVENDRVVKLDGSHRSDYTDGYICAKVRGFTARQYSPERVLRPMKRVGPKGAGLSETISWDEALQRIAERFTGIANTSGPEAILPFHFHIAGRPRDSVGCQRVRTDDEELSARLGECGQHLGEVAIHGRPAP